ncbi:hypothetical protein ACFX2I_009902 [Malus domestica]
MMIHLWSSVLDITRIPQCDSCICMLLARISIQHI